MGTSLTMLAHASVSLKYWNFAFESAVFLINHFPFATLNNKSPFQILFNQPSEYRFLKVFGYSVFPLLRPYN